MLLYTSGTTGPAKRFLLTGEQLAANLGNLLRARLVGAADRVLLPLPMHHIYPFAVGLLVPLLSKSTVVLPEAVTGTAITQALRSGDISVIVGVPRLYSALLAGVKSRIRASGTVRRVAFDVAFLGVRLAQRRLGVNAGRLLFRSVRAQIAPHLRLLVSGGAPMESETLWFLSGLGFEVRTGYGLAETASVFTANIPGSERAGSEGRPLGDGRIRIIAEDNSADGEIQLRGSAVFTGYEDNPAATAEAFTPDGWFRTGDLGHLDVEGFLYVSGRTKERIVLAGGKKVFPDELERHYGDSPYIREIAVLEFEGSLVALVVPDFDEARRDRVARIDEAVRVHLASRAQGLPAYRRLAGYRLSREPLPRTRLGKYRRFLLAERYAAAAESVAVPVVAESDPLLQKDAARRAWDILRERYVSRAFTLDSHLLLDLGIDSFEWVALGLLLEERLGIQLSQADMTQLVTVRDLLQAVLRAPADISQAETFPPLPPRHERGLAGRFLARLIYGMNSALMHGLFHLRVVGVERLPERGPFVLVANHASDLDAPALAAALGFARVADTYWAAAPSRLVAKRWMQPFLRFAQVFAVREDAPEQFLDFADALLRAGKIVVMFPEAWRTPDGQLQPFRAGVGQLLVRARVAAVPVAVLGSFAAWPRHRRLPRPHPIKIRIGARVAPSELPPAGSEHAHAIADTLHDQVATLLTAHAGP
jgi:long-chain acyl-CoA synthetase